MHQPCPSRFLTDNDQFLHAVSLDHWVYLVPFGHRIATVRCRPSYDRPHTGLHCACCVVFGSRRQYSRWFWCCQEPSLLERIPPFRLLRRLGMPLFY
jgi:hypothetical protein